MEREDMVREFRHFRERLYERYGISLSIDECEDLVSQIDKGLYLKAQLSGETIVILLMIKGEIVSVAYIPSRKYIATCLNILPWQKIEIRNEILSYHMYGKYFDKLKESNLKLERFQTCLG
jgi:hypothetical protein